MAFKDSGFIEKPLIRRKVGLKRLLSMILIPVTTLQFEG